MLKYFYFKSGIKLKDYTFTEKDFSELNIDGNIYEKGLNGLSAVYLRHCDGNWYKYENLLSKQLSKQEVINSASTSGIDFIYHKKYKI